MPLQALTGVVEWPHRGWGGWFSRDRDPAKCPTSLEIKENAGGSRGSDSRSHCSRNTALPPWGWGHGRNYLFHRPLSGHGGALPWSPSRLASSPTATAGERYTWAWLPADSAQTPVSASPQLQQVHTCGGGGPPRQAHECCWDPGHEPLIALLMEGGNL